MPLGCTTTRTLQISFTPPALAPANGYIVKWRTVGDSAWNTVSPAPSASPVIIGVVPACGNIEGTIQTNCGGGVAGPVTNFLATGLGYPISYSLLKTTTCTGSGTSLTLNGKAGDVVVLKITGNGYVTYDGTSTGGAGMSLVLSGGGQSSSINSSRITSGSNGVTANTTITFTMPTDTVVLTTTAVVHNSTSTVANSAFVELISVNGVPNNASAAVCVGFSTGAW